MKRGDLFILDKKGLREFYSMNELVGHMKRNIYVMSWGANDFTNIDKYALRFKVQGRHFKGHVVIVVNGLDYFDIYFTKTPLMKIVDMMNDVCIDELIERIDVRVEKIKI